jgi:transposase-like protein
MLESLGREDHQMPRIYPPEFRRQVIELARAGTRVKQLAATFQMSDATIYNWLKQDRIDRGEAEGATTSQQLELAAAKRRLLVDDRFGERVSRNCRVVRRV